MQLSVNFSDVAEDDLPEDVKNNAAWVSICAQFRKNKFHNKKMEKAREQDWREMQALFKKDEDDRRGNHASSSSTQQQSNTETAHAKRPLHAEQQTQQVVSHSAFLPRVSLRLCDDPGPYELIVQS